MHPNVQYATPLEDTTYLALHRHAFKKQAYPARMDWIGQHLRSRSYPAATRTAWSVGRTAPSAPSARPPSSCSTPPTARVAPTTHSDSAVSWSAESVVSRCAPPSTAATVEPITRCVCRVERTDTDEREEERTATRTQRRGTGWTGAGGRLCCEGVGTH